MKLPAVLNSLRYRIAAWSFIPTALVLVGVGLVSFIAFQQTTRYLLIERNREVVHLTAVQLASELEEYPIILSGVAEYPLMTSPKPGERQMALNRLHNSLVVFDGGVVVTDQHGQLMASDPFDLRLNTENWSDSASFRQIIRTMAPNFSDIIAGPEGVRWIVISVPILGQNNEFLGVVAGRFQVGASNISLFYGNIVKLRMGVFDQANLSTYLVDGAGQVIYHTDDGWIGADFSQQKAVQYFLAGNYIDEFGDIVQESSDTSRRAGVVRSSDVQGSSVVYFSPVPGTSWGLVSEASWARLLNLYRPYLIIQTFLFVFGVLFPALFVGFRIRRITEPIYQLKAAAKEVAEGNLGHTIIIETGDELEELADQFNHMSIQLAQSYAAIEERVQERTHELATLNEVSKLVNRPLSLDQILRDVLQTSAQVLCFDFGVVYRFEMDDRGGWSPPEPDETPEPDRLYLSPIAAWGSTGAPEIPSGRFRVAGSGFELALGSDKSRLTQVDAAGIDRQLLPADYSDPGNQILLLPLIVKDRALGMALFGGCTSNGPTPEELDLLAGIGQQIGVVLENDRLHQLERKSVQETAILEERARLARELHDSVTQSMYSITLLAEAAARLLSSGESQTASSHLQVLRDSAQESLREMRLLIFELRPIALEKNDLAEALRIRLESVEARSGIKTDLQVNGDDRLSYAAKLELYQIAQETLNNVLKHSRAQKVGIELNFTEDQACLQIVDDGQGFDPAAAANRGGLGLSGMVERAAKIQAELKITSAPGQGSRIFVQVPLK